MSKKRKSQNKFKAFRSSNHTKPSAQQLLSEQIENNMVRILYYSHTPLTLPEIFSKKSAKKFDKKTSTAALESLVRKGLLKKTGKGVYAIDPSAPLYRGKLIQNAKGFGFVQGSGIGTDTQTLQRDLFIAKRNMSGAMHDDTVLVQGRIAKNDKRTEGIIVDIIEQRANRLAGIVSKRGHEIFVYPDDPRFPFKVSLKERKDIPLKSGDAVIVEYKRPTLPTPTLSGKLLTLLGDADDIDTQMELVISSHDLPHIFAGDVIEETDQLDGSFMAGKDRLDLRNLQHITIDGETAKDFDDAIYIEKTAEGFRLYVSIADVSHFVSPGSAIDKEAYLRGTSVYFPGRVIPMLPERLSNNLCSLVPHEDRYTVSAILDFSREGKLVRKDFARSIIHSHQRFTYTTVRQILIDKDADVQKAHQAFLLQLKCAGELATALQKKRTARGSIDFNITEPFFTLNEDGKIASISAAERNFAHQIIEEFMLAANEAVASFFIEKEIAAIFRTHESPDESKLADFLTFVNSLGLPLAPFKNEAAWFSDTLKKCKATKYDYIINNLLLRSLKQAQYTAENIGHFGLAAPAYTHFTSPIRRYPDLIVHRLLISLIGSKKALDEDQKKESFHEAGTFLSARERTAVTAERDMNDRLKIAYMKDKIGDHFSAIISGVTETNIFVEIVDLCISGAVPVELLTGDYYLFDKKNYRLFGEISRKTYQIGDSVEITLADVDYQLRRLTFKMSDTE